MDVSPDQLLLEIGRLHVANSVLVQQLAASRQQLVKLAAEQAAESPDEPESLPTDQVADMPEKPFVSAFDSAVEEA